MTTNLTAFLQSLVVGWLISNPGQLPKDPPYTSSPTPLACNLSVTAQANPSTICMPGQTVNLNAIVQGGMVTQVMWTPTTGVANPNSLNTTAVVNQTTTLTVNVSGTSNMNLITNGNFNAGFGGFTSDYIPGTGGSFGLLSSEGQYAVATNASLTHTNFANCPDHTGGGNMLVVNGAGVPNQDILCQTINVIPFTNYSFSAWVASVISTSPAQLQFSFNGAIVGGIFSPPATTCQWQQFSQIWNSGGASSVEICIVNQNTALSGNDFAIDDLFLAEVCTAVNTVTVNVVNLNAAWTAPTNLCTQSSPLLLNSLLNPGSTPGGTWTVNGFPTNVFDPGQWGAGAHTVTYNVTQAPCSDVETHFIVVLPLPVATWAPPPNLCIGSPVFNLNTMLLPSSQTGGTWTVNGAPATIFNPAVLGVGPHVVTYTVGTFPCINNYTQTIEINPLPNAAWTPPPPLCTTAPAFNLNTLLSPGALSGGVWRINGAIATMFNPATLGAGSFNVSYTVGSAPCGATITQPITVNAPPAVPQPSCGQVTESAITINWPAVAGASSYIVNINNTQQVTVTGATYTSTGLIPGQTVQYQVQSLGANGCNSVFSGSISCTTTLCIPAVVTIDPVATLCNDNPASEIQLIVNLSDTTGMGAWSGPGITDTVEGLFSPALAGPGAHLVRFDYEVNDCASFDTILIIVQNPPIVAIQGDTTICVGDTAMISFSGIADSTAAYTWQFDGGAISSGSGAGPYQITWASSGLRTIALSVTQGVCEADTTHDIQVVAPLTPPAINCQTTSSTITFYWPDDPGVQGYTVNILQGPGGMMDSDTSFAFTGLTPGDSVTIALVASTGGPCPDLVVERTCIAADCPIVDITLTAPDLICTVPNQANITLQATTSGGSGNGTGIWSGSGIINTATGLFSPLQANTGTNIITYTYTENNCTYTANTSIDVFPRPTASFIAQDTICLLDTIAITYTGTASAAATYDWNFADGIVHSGSGQGPYMVSWPTAGVRLLRLRVEENGCQSSLSVQGIQVDPPIDIPVLACDPSFTTTDFYWNNVANAQAYIVIVTEGPFGEITSDTSFSIMGLMPGQHVEILLTTISENACPGSVQPQDCTTLSCDSIALDIQTMPAVCLGASPAIINIPYNLVTTGSGILSWSGPGIIDPALPDWSPAAAGAGQHTIYVNYSDGLCTAADSVVIDVFDTPLAAFTLTPDICRDSTAQVSFTGTAGPGATYSWDFDGATVQSGSGAGPYELSWSTDGPHTVSLDLTENGCAAAQATQQINVSTPLSTPVINCTTGLTSVSFSWPQVDQADTYMVAVLTGPSGTATSDTSYVFNGLTPGTQVEISVTAFGDGICPATVAQLACTAGLCPPITIDIAPPALVCIDNTPETIDLSATLTGSGGGGTFTWSGNGITDASEGLWTPQAGMAGQVNWVFVTYEESVCTYTDSLAIDVFLTPVADFSLPASVCSDSLATIAFTGTAGVGALYAWNFDGGTATPGTGAGPHQVNWPNAGIYDISLVLSENGCVSPQTLHNIVVDAPLDAPQLSCSSTLNSITLSWPDVDQAAGYDLLAPVGYTPNWTSPTSVVFDNVMPSTTLMFSVTALDSASCSDVTSTLSCTTLPCPSLSLAWSAPAAVCEGTPATLNWSGTGGNTSFEVILSVNGMADTLTGISQGSVSTFPINQTTTFAVTGASTASAPGCAVTLPPSLTVTLNRPLSPGVVLADPALCSGADSLIALADLLMGEDMGGIWQEISQPPSTGNAFDAADGTFYAAQQASGIYRFRYFLDAAAPCADSSSIVQILINPNPVADAGPDQTLSCQVNEVTLGGTGTSQGNNLTYLWTSAGGAMTTTPNLSQTTAGQADSYTLTVINTATGCSDIDAVVVQSGVNFLTPYITTTPLSCFASNDGVIVVDSVVGGLAPYQYSFNNQPFTSQSFFSSLTPGVYNLLIRDATGCESELLLNVSQPNALQVELITNLEGNETIIQLGDSIWLQALINIPAEQLDTVIWRPEQADCENCLSVRVSPTVATTYGITIVDENGCQTEDILTLYVRKQRDIYIPNGFSPNNDGLNDVFMIFGGQEVQTINSFLVFSRWGESLFQAYNFQANDPTYGWDGNFRSRPLNAGVYVYFAEVTFIDGVTEIFKGDVTLMR